MTRAAWLVTLAARNAGMPEPTGCTGAIDEVDKFEAHDPHSRMIMSPLGEREAVPAAPNGGTV